EVIDEGISIPGGVVFSQLHLSCCTYYESAWRTVNTGSNPVDRKEIAGKLLSRPSRRPPPVHGRAPAGRPRLRRELSGEVLRRGGSLSMGRYGPVVDDLRRRASERRSSSWARIPGIAVRAGCSDQSESSEP